MNRRDCVSVWTKMFSIYFAHFLVLNQTWCFLITMNLWRRTTQCQNQVQTNHAIKLVMSNDVRRICSTFIFIFCFQNYFVLSSNVQNWLVNTACIVEIFWLCAISVADTYGIKSIQFTRTIQSLYITFWFVLRKLLGCSACTIYFTFSDIES